MPIYAYRCSACGHAKDVLQKISDPVLSTCPACGVEAFSKQVTAAGFQLKGSGWYVTDFRNGSKSGTSSTAPSTKSDESPGKSESGTSESGKSESGKSDSAKPEAAATGAGGCGGACACH